MVAVRAHAERAAGYPNHILPRRGLALECAAVRHLKQMRRHHRFPTELAGAFALGGVAPHWITLQDCCGRSAVRNAVGTVIPGAAAH
jgi:hypothetical protein